MKTVLIIDFGSQVTQLIARRVREAGVFSIVLLPEEAINYIQKNKNIKGIFLSGGPSSVYENSSPSISKDIFNFDIPIFGICYGQQLICKLLGGEVEPCTNREYGKSSLKIIKEDILFQNLKETQAWMSHGDIVTKLPDNFEVLAHTDGSPFAVIKSLTKQIYATQFHPEVTHSLVGECIIRNFLFEICKLEPEWKMSSYASMVIEDVKKQIGTKKAICALSGGVDSTVAAEVVKKAIGDNLTCIFVDHGFLRKNEGEEVLKMFQNQLIYINAQEEFFLALKNISEPEQKRKIIGKKFIEIFEREAKKIDGAEFLVQGTIYPDVIESATSKSSQNSHKIKSHHNVGGLPEDMKLLLVEPLRDLFKDEVRNLGIELGINKDRVFRHPFPGPGLAIRILGEPTQQKVRILQEADDIYIKTLKEFNLYDKIWQAFCVLTNSQTVGVMGDGRTYDHVLAVRAVTSTDGMTADFYPFDMSFLATLSNRITNSVKGISRVVYDITSKPPATIEWE